MPMFRFILTFLIITLLIAQIGTGTAWAEESTQVRIEMRVLEWKVGDTLDFDFAVDYTPNSLGGGILQAADLTLPRRPGARFGYPPVFQGSSGR